jgi:NPCBM/NEW2 domain/Bacterial Ig-like domain (group 2)/Bacterial Ig-like domain
MLAGRSLSSVLGRAGLALALSTLLFGCGQPPATNPVSPGTEMGRDYPYTAGQDYSWTDVPSASALAEGHSPWSGPVIRALDLPTVNYISDLSWSSATSGYGPIELDKSNNTNARGDGLPLTIGGQVFAKGLGLHANSEVRYAVNGACTTFTASVGLDDEVGARGSVVFEVWNGTAARLYTSGLLTGADLAKPVSVDLTGVQTLRLVVSDGNGSTANDHADWADAKVSCTAPQPSGEKFLSDLTPITASNGYGPYERDKSNNERADGDGQPLRLNGTVYPKGLGVHAPSQLVYDVGGNCSTFSAEVGVDDEVGVRGSVVFQVFADNAPLFDSGVLTGADPARAVSVSISGKRLLKLVVTDGNGSTANDHADWANAKVSCSVVQPTVTSVVVSPDKVALSPNGSQQLTAEVKGSGAFDPGVTWASSDPGVVRVSSTGLINAVSAGTATVTATSTFDPSKLGSALVTVSAASTLPPGGLLINFQPLSSAVPVGYTADTGLAYSDVRGYGWVREDSLGAAPATPLDVSPNARDRALVGIDARLNTFIHMQFPASVSNAAAVRTPAAWEYALPSGVYSVTVGVGDASNSYDSGHQINIEGQLAIPALTPLTTRKFAAATLRANVSDGKLTIDARGGTNTKIDYVLIRAGDRPSIRASSPQDAQTMVATTLSLTADVNLPNSAIDLATLSASSVRVINAGTSIAVAASLNTSGGGDAVVIKPSTPLDANTRYIFEVTSDLRDTTGAPFLPLRSSFTTGMSAVGSGVAFEQISQPSVPAMPYTSVEVGPDNKLYAATLTGEILRFGMMPDGMLSAPQTITSVQTANGGPRTIIGMKFDPAATADNLIMWISNNYFWDGSSDAPDWSGKITRLSGADLETVQDYIVGLPRSIRDHQTNSVSFRPGEPGALYVLQGSNSAMGAPDTAWGNRPERLLSGALLKIDLSRIPSPPLNVKTSEGGLYNPYAPGAPLTIYASGIRNAFDMVWHSNGQLYVPTNGSAAGGNTPGTPTTLPASCNTRPDGPYTGPSVPALNSIGVEHDYLFRVTSGGYYGHPNPERCEWVMNGANPTGTTDSAEVPEYPVGTLPDRNYRGFAYDFGEHVSPNGVIEEYTSAGTSVLRGKLLVVRYSAGKDIIILTPGGPNQDIVSAQTFVTGLSNFSPTPIDLSENRTSGHIYVAQLDEVTGSGSITLVRLK